MKSCLSQIKRELKLTGFLPDISKLSELVEFCMRLSGTTSLILIFDECQELDYAAPKFWSELQNVWDKIKMKVGSSLIMSGSIISAIKHIFSDANEPLYGRTDLLLKIKPFSCHTIRRYLEENNPDFTAEDLLMFYAMTGGVPRYMELLTSSGCSDVKSFKSSSFLKQVHGIDKTAMSSLGNEFRMESSAYFSLLRAIAHGKTRWSELQNEVSTNLAPYMSRLETQFNLLKRTILSARKIPGEVPVIFLQMSISVSGSNLLNP